MDYNSYRYLKNGDLSGDLCINCGRDLYIQKGVTIWLKYRVGKDIPKKTWKLRCHCGYETDFKKNNVFKSAFK